MGIYISGVKGLPEQVQANKEDIKTIKEEIEGIDFEEIRQLENQVAENTGDINNLEASIGVQNQAINGLKDRADALDSKTQLITYNSDYGMTDFRNSIEVADDVYASNVRVMGDGSIVNTTQSGMHFKEGANDDTLTIANNDGTTPHYLHFNADGTLDIDGQPIGKTYYQHNLRLVDCLISDTMLTISIINESNEAINSVSKLNDYLTANNFTDANTLLLASGFTYYASGGTTRPMAVIGVYISGGYLYAFGGVVNATTNKYVSLTLSIHSRVQFVTDTIVEL